jgi:hypothetical protein
MKERLGITIHWTGYVLALVFWWWMEYPRELGAFVFISVVFLLPSYAIKYVLTGRKGLLPWMTK